MKKTLFILFIGSLLFANANGQGGICSWYFSANHSNLHDYNESAIGAYRANGVYDTTIIINNIPIDTVCNFGWYNGAPGQIAECWWHTYHINLNGSRIYSDSFPPPNRIGAGWRINVYSSGVYDIYADYIDPYHSSANNNYFGMNIHIKLIYNYQAPNSVYYTPNDKPTAFLNSDYHLKINHSSDIPEGIISYYDLTGRLLNSEPFRKQGSAEWLSTFSFRSLPAGLYFWNIQSDSGTSLSGKIEVNH